MLTLIGALSREPMRFRFNGTELRKAHFVRVYHFSPLYNLTRQRTVESTRARPYEKMHLPFAVSRALWTHLH
jgi:hypothetical protein